jgi:hypothetical protein
MTVPDPMGAKVGAVMVVGGCTAHSIYIVYHRKCWGRSTALVTFGWRTSRLVRRNCLVAAICPPAEATVWGC